MTESPITCTLRQRRKAVRLSQSELAKRVRVSRQAISAIEAGRQVPSTGLALQLARALGCTVEDLFALPSAPLLRAVLAPGCSPGRGAAQTCQVAVGRVDGVWAAHAIFDGTGPGDGLIVGDVDGCGRVRVEPLAELGALAQNVLVTGCAPLLGVLTGRLGRRFRDARATWVPANSGRALELLKKGLVHVAGVHLVDAQAPGGHTSIVRERFPESETVIVNLTRWRQGLLIAPGNPLGISSVEDLLRPGVRFARREAGAGAHKLVQRLLKGADESLWANGPVASTHAEVARLVRWGVTDAGIAIEAAAFAEGLDFIPLSEERFDLIIPRARVDAPPVARLLDLIENPSFRLEASRLPGYDLSISGHSTTVK